MIRFSLALALIAVAAAPQDGGSPPPKVEAKAPAAGDRTDVKIESTIELEIEASSNQEGEPKQTRQLSYARTLECSQVVQSVADGGVPTWRVTVGSAKVQRSGTNIAPVTETSEIENKSYIITRGEKGRVVKAENGDPTPADASGLGAWEDFGKLLPAGEAKEGATWQVDAATITALISIPDVAAPTGTFDAKVESSVEGKLTVFFSGELKGKTAKGFETSLKVAEGRLDYDSAKNRPVSLAITGSLTAEKPLTQKVSKAKELRQVDEAVGTVKVKTSKLEVKAEFK
ncbi:MAG TPA: hypothetical protein VFS19_07090 [Planctomycetota bacterium]|nr:hypothetical protein [Planctomycetota bacterium]